MARVQWIEQQFRDCVESYGYGEIRTPLLESSELFQRSLGATSDVVSKEMYAFSDKGGRAVTLRPEGTAGVARCAIEESWRVRGELPRRLWYSGAMFRYERPQRGRLRQFAQLGVEALGLGGAAGDAEAIVLADRFLFGALRVPRAAVRLKLNTLGSAESRAEFSRALAAFLTPLEAQLSAESVERVRRGAALRVLDSKDPRDRAALAAAAAPRLLQFLDAAAIAAFRDLQMHLDALGVPFEHDPSLVRGLDYYQGCVFEFVATGHAGAQNAVLAGGRYDGLLDSASGAGWACGVERLADLLADLPSPISVPRHQPLTAVVAVAEPEDPHVQRAVLRVAERARAATARPCVHYLGSGWGTKRQMARASADGVRFALLVGPDEVERGVVQIKDMRTQEQQEIPLF